MKQFIELLEECLDPTSIDACNRLNAIECIYNRSNISSTCESCMFVDTNRDILKQKLAILKTIELISN